MPPATIAAVTDHGTLARTVDRDLPGAQDALTRLLRLGIDLDEVSAALEAEGVSSFIQSFRALRGVLAAKTAALVGQNAADA